MTCTENILSGGPAEDGGELGPLVGQLVVATNVFRRTDEGWKVWSHHGSPVLTDCDEDQEGGRIRLTPPRGPRSFAGKFEDGRRRRHWALDRSGSPGPEPDESRSDSGGSCRAARPEGSWAPRRVPEEREEGQTFIVDLVLGLDTRPAAADDDLAKTVHYGVVAEEVVDVVRESRST